MVVGRNSIKSDLPHFLEYHGAMNDDSAAICRESSFRVLAIG